VSELIVIGYESHEKAIAAHTEVPATPKDFVADHNGLAHTNEDRDPETTRLLRSPRQRPVQQDSGGGDHRPETGDSDDHPDDDHGMGGDQAGDQQYRPDGETRDRSEQSSAAPMPLHTHSGRELGVVLGQ
jgi:hypothetical protein